MRQGGSQQMRNWLREQGQQRAEASSCSVPPERGTLQALSRSQCCHRKEPWALPSAFAGEGGAEEAGEAVSAVSCRIRKRSRAVQAGLGHWGSCHTKRLPVFLLLPGLALLGVCCVPQTSACVFTGHSPPHEVTSPVG